ncbi:MAG: zf-HC2 domain-containing protein [Clostridia bacterium]|nr:zf-HC2 domain-containing protein [Clostridia bacterium]
MNKFDCEIIKDLLPLYADNVCSERSAKAVKEHLGDCSECSEELRKIRECPVVPEVDEDLKKAVKSAGKRIKKRNRKTIIETVALVLILVILFGVIGMYRFILYGAKANNEAFSDGAFPYSQECESVDIDLVNKEDYENNSATLCVGEKYKVEKYEDGNSQKLVVSKDKYIHFIEYEFSLKSGISSYMNDMFFPAKPFVKWGLDLMGYSPDLAPGYDLSFYEMILEMPEPEAPFFCSPEAYAKALTYYTVKDSMGIGSGYLLVKNSEFYCIGTKMITEKRCMYAFDIQSKENLDKNIRLIFVGYDNQDEVLEVLSSLKIK